MLVLLILLLHFRGRTVAQASLLLGVQKRACSSHDMQAGLADLPAECRPCRRLVHVTLPRVASRLLPTLQHAVMSSVEA